MKINYLYIVIFLLLGIVFLQKQCTPTTPIAEPKAKIDTVIVEKIIRDTIPGKPKLIKAKIDTSIWMKKSEYRPDTSYNKLIEQYKHLGNQYFATNIFKSEFPTLYGKITIIDTVSENRITGTKLITDLIISEKTVIIKENIPAKNQLYAGFELAGNSTYPIKGGYAGLILKTKKDKIYGLSLGYQDELILKGSMYWKIKIK